MRSFLLLLLALLGALPARAENVYIMDLNLAGIYSVDVTTGGPATLLTTIPTTGQGYTLATRPADGMLFFLDSNGANPNLWRWDPNNPTQTPVLVGTPGANTTNVVRLGFDSAGNLLAMDTTSNMWTLDMNTGGIISTTPLSGSLPTQSGDLCLNTTNGVLYMVANQQLYTVTSSGVSTLQGTITGIGTGTNALVTGCAFTRNGTLLISLYGGGRLYTVNLNTFAATALPTASGVTNIGDLASAPERTADLSLTKTASNATPGSTVNFTVTITNAGPARVTDARVLDQLPTGLTFVSYTATQGTYSTAASGAIPAYTWRVGALAAGASATMVMTATVTGTTAITNTAQVSYSDQFDPDSTPNNSVAGEDDQASVTITPSPDLQVTKTANGSFAVGSNGTYTLKVNNAGSASTSGTYTVTDVLPTGLTYVSATGTGWSCSSTSGTVTCNSSTLIAPGATSANAITLTVLPAAAAAPQVTNTATVSGGGEPASLNGNNTSTVTTAVCNSNCPDLTVNKTLSTGTLTVGTTATYTLSVTNIGGIATTAGYTITDPLPTGITLNAAPTAGTGWTCTASGSTNTAGGNAVSCTRTTALAAGATSTNVTFVVNVANTAVPQVTNTASVTGGGEPPATQGNNSTSLTTPVTDFDLTISKVKTGGGDFVMGVTTASYTFTVSNVGGRATVGAYTFTDTLPAGLTITGATSTWTIGGGWTCTASGTTTNVAGGTIISCTRSTAINAGASSTTVVVPVTVGAAAAPSVTNTATVTGVNEAAALTGNNSSTVTTPVDAVDLVVTKSHSGNFAVGVNGLYTLTASNIGLQATTGTITVVDTLPTGLTYVSATGTNWTCSFSSPNVTCTRTTAIAANDSAPPISLTVTPTAAAASASPVVNTATVSGGNEPAGNAGNDTVNDTTYVYNPPVIAKAFAPATVAAGGTSVLTLTITNPAGSGVASMAGVAFVDPFPAGLSVANPPSLTNTCGGSITSGGVQGDTIVVLSGGSLGGPGTSCQIQVRVTAPSVGSLVNTTGQVSSSNAGTGNTASATLTVTAPGNPVLTKITAPNPVSVGASSTLTFTITNTNATTNDIGFTDTLAAGVIVASGGTFGGTCTSTTGTALSRTNGTSGGRTTITVAGVDLAANASCTVTIPVTSNSVGSYPNTSSNISGLAGGLTATTVNDTLVVQAATLTKAFTPSTILLGQTATMSFELDNTAEAPQQTGLAFTETLPAGLVLAAAPAASQCNGTVTGTAGGTTVTVTGARLALGLDSCTITTTVTSSTAGNYVNAAANVTGLSSNLINAVNATLAVTVPLPTLTKTDNQATIAPGDTTTYVITVGNTTGNTFTGATAVVLKDPAVTNLTVSSVACAAAGGATCPALTSAQMITALQAAAGMTLPALPNGGTLTFTVVAALSGNPTGTLTNTVTATVGSNSVSATDSDTIVYPGLVVSKTVAVLNDPVNGVTNPKNIPGAEVLYTVIVTNTGQGKVDADSMQLADPVPANTSLFVGDLGGSPSGPVTYTDSGSGLTFGFTSLASTTDDVEFSNNNGSTWTYTPVADANGYDATVTNVRMRPKGRMTGWTGSGGYPSFTFTFKVKIR
jgi:uncharacterized repeat protein (TIGR01451 family)/fimbrial isopeptide formation D2 family protein